MAKEPLLRADARRSSTAVKEGRLLPVAVIDQLHAWANATLTAGGPQAPIAALVLILFGTAARRMELQAFKIKDFTAGLNGPMVCFRIAKGNKTGDVVPLTNEAWRTYQAWLAWKQAHDESVAPDAPVLCGRPGEHMGLVTIWRHWKTALAAVGVTGEFSAKRGVHAARHAAAYLLFRSTKDYSSVKRLLRHENVKTTEDFYEHFDLDSLRSEMEKAGL
jgi:integrase